MNERERDRKTEIEREEHNVCMDIKVRCIKGKERDKTERKRE
jgi:hypothetical protein